MEGGGVGSVHSTITLRGHVEGRFDRGTVIRVGVSDVEGLVEEKDIAVRVPRVLVVCHARLVGDLARAQLEEQSRCRRNRGPPVE